jgi:TolA-binding protein
MQVSAGAEAGEVRATYDSMLQLTPTEQQRRDGLYLVAAALIGAGDGATARDLLNQYESEYGATEATQALLRRSEP